MIYSIIYDDNAWQFIEKLPNAISKRIIRKLDSVMINPYRYFEKLEDNSLFRMRVGDYRILADIDESSKKIYVRFIGHRKNIYK